MTSTDPATIARFVFSVVRVVPDPIKEEAVNIGVVVVPLERGAGEMLLNLHVRSRLRAMHRSYPVGSLEASVKGLRSALGLDPQPEFGARAHVPVTPAHLEATALRLNGQLQLTRPQVYLAASAEEAVGKLFRRYVSRRPAAVAKGDDHLTHAALKERIWREVREWEHQNVHIARGAFIEGREARHPADIVISNGVPKAALFALATHRDDLNLSYLYRDSLPTIARDMGKGFRVFAVLPETGSLMSADDRQFAAETRALLAKHPDVTTLGVDELRRVQAEVVAPLL